MFIRSLIFLMIFVFTAFAVLTFFILTFFNTNDNTTNVALSSDNICNSYKGLVLFDIDGTLTGGNTVETNSSIVQACIDNSFAVGICTAGSKYSMENILSYTDWMPKNLYDFIIKHDNVTFNNVASKILMGKPDDESYSELPDQHPGFLKGFALEKTANALGITNPKCMILCDDDSGYITHFLSYNPDLNVVCSGVSCGGIQARLNIEDVKNAMSKCS
jgi:hypothetical protein